MKPDFAQEHRQAFPINPDIRSRTVCELHSAVKRMDDRAVLRAAEDFSGLCIYSVRKTNKLAELSCKSASVSAHKKAMQALIYQTCDALASEPLLEGRDLRALAALSWEASNSAINGTDIPVARIKPPLKHLNNLIQRYERARKAEELKWEPNPCLKSKRDYLTLFTKMNESDLTILRQALFKRDKSVSLAEQKIILRSIFVLINAYLTQSGQRKTLAQLIRHFPQRDLLLKFANAWLTHIEGHQRNHPNLLVTFSWEKTITQLTESIRRELGKLPIAQALYVSPGLAALLSRDEGVFPASPTTLALNHGLEKILAPVMIADSAPEVVVDEAPMTSLPSLPEISDLDDIILVVDDRANPPIQAPQTTAVNHNDLPVRASPYLVGESVSQ